MCSMTSPILYSEIFEGTKPQALSVKSLSPKILVHIFVEKGPVQIRFNDDEQCPLKLYSGCKWNLRFFDAKLESIKIDPINKKEYKVWIIVERI